MSDRMLQWFRCEHLAPEKAAVARHFGELAQVVVNTLPSNPERTVCLRHLLDAKEAAVRAYAEGVSPRPQTNGGGYAP